VPESANHPQRYGQKPRKQPELVFWVTLQAEPRAVQAR